MLKKSGDCIERSDKKNTAKQKQAMLKKLSYQ